MPDQAPGNTSYRRIWAAVIGFGIALSPIHNRWLTELVTSGGEVGFFIPAFGTAVWLMGTLLFIADSKDWGEMTSWRSWGDRRIYIPLLVIVCAIGASGAAGDTWGAKLAPLLMGISLFALFLVARVLGRDMFLPLAAGAALASAGVAVSSILYPGEITGGLLFEHNYDIVVGYVLLGAALLSHHKRWILAAAALVAMFLSGSPEAVFVIACLAITVLLRRDWGKRLGITVGVVATVAAVWFSLGWGQQLYSYTADILHNDPTEQPPLEEQIEMTAPRDPIGYRMLVIREAFRDIKPTGEGYNLTGFHPLIAHNVPAVIVQQLGWPGVAAAAAWLWVSVWCLVRTKWKYAWVLLLSLSVFDHFIWTQMAPYWWLVAGVSTTDSSGDGSLFRMPPETQKGAP